MDREKEIALALSACPPALATKAAVYVLDRSGYVKVQGGENGFTAIVQHSRPATQEPQCMHALQAMRIGDFSMRLPSERTGLEGKIADTFNEIVAANERMASELEHVGKVVGREGKTRTRVKFGLQSGAWAAMEASVNDLIDDLLWPTTAVTHAITGSGAGRSAASIVPHSGLGGRAPKPMKLSETLRRLSSL
jgi:hypothetical protein